MTVLVAQSVRLFVTPRNVAHQAPLSMEFSRQEYWSSYICIHIYTHTHMYMYIYVNGVAELGTTEQLSTHMHTHTYIKSNMCQGLYTQLLLFSC